MTIKAKTEIYVYCFNCGEKISSIFIYTVRINDNHLGSMVYCENCFDAVKERYLDEKDLVKTTKKKGKKK